MNIIPTCFIFSTQFSHEQFSYSCHINLNFVLAATCQSSLGGCIVSPVSPEDSGCSAVSHCQERESPLGQLLYHTQRFLHLCFLCRNDPGLPCESPMSLCFFNNSLKALSYLHSHQNAFSYPMSVPAFLTGCLWVSLLLSPAPFPTCNAHTSAEACLCLW